MKMKQFYAGKREKSYERISKERVLQIYYDDCGSHADECLHVSDLFTIRTGRKSKKESLVLRWQILLWPRQEEGKGDCCNPGEQKREQYGSFICV